MIKKLTLLASLALAALAFSVPAMASAAEWGMEGNPIEEPVEVHLTGKIKFTNPAVGGGDPSFNCPVTANVVLTPGASGHVTAFNVTNPAECEAGGVLAALGCEVGEVHSTASTSNWPIAITGADTIGINGFDVTNTYKAKANCPTSTTIVDLGINSSEEVTGTGSESKLCHLAISGGAAGGLLITGTLTATTCTYEII